MNSGITCLENIGVYHISVASYLQVEHQKNPRLQSLNQEITPHYAINLFDLICQISVTELGKPLNYNL